MASRKIDIRLASGFDPSGVNAASRSMDKLAADLERSNKWLMQINAELSEAIRNNASKVTVDLGAQADKTVKTAIRSAKEIEEAWRKACETIGDPRPTNTASGNLGRLGQVAKGVAKGIGGAFNSVAQMFLQGGIWGGVSLGLTKAWDAISEKIKAARESAERISVEKLSKELKSVNDGASKIADCFDKNTAAIDRQLQKESELLAVQKKLVDAAIELQKQRELAAAAGNTEAQAIIERKFATRKADADFTGSEVSLRNRYENARGWVEADDKYLRDMSKWLSDVDKRIESNKAKAAEIESHARAAASRGSVNNMAEYLDSDSDYGEGKEYARIKKQIEELSAARVKGEQNVAKARERRSDSIGKMDAIAKEIKALEDLREARIVEDERFVKEREAAIDKIEKDEENAAAHAAAKAADEREKAELAAAKAAAAERDRLDRELHAKRMADLRAELATQKEAAAPLQATAAAAQSEFERAFAMYRDPSRAAAEIGEEKDRAEDLERLHRDASRYGGKWRIDELSQLMAAGDSQGVDSRLAEWRKSRSFSPEVEAMVRASAAEQTKTTAEDELRKLNEKTGELTQKLETLAQSRDGKLDGIERNTNQLANKLDELLTVKG